MNKKGETWIVLVIRAIRAIIYVILFTLYNLGTIGIGMSALQVIRDNTTDLSAIHLLGVGIGVWMFMNLWMIVGLLIKIDQAEVNIKCIK